MDIFEFLHQGGTEMWLLKTSGVRPLELKQLLWEAWGTSLRLSPAEGVVLYTDS